MMNQKIRKSIWESLCNGHKIVEKGGRFLYALVDGMLYVSDGHWLLRFPDISVPETAKVHLRDADEKTRQFRIGGGVEEYPGLDLRDFLVEGVCRCETNLETSNFRHTPDGGASVSVVMATAESRVWNGIDARYFDMILHVWPNARFVGSDPQSAIAIYDGLTDEAELVGLIMPVRIASPNDRFAGDADGR